MLGMLLMLVAISLVRVIGAIVRRETFGAEATAALLAVVLAALVVRDGLRR